MTDQAPEPRHGHPWDATEDAQLVDRVREGLELEELAGRHGRSAGAIRARLARFVTHPAPEPDEVLEWLRARLAAEPGYPWRAVMEDRRYRDQLERAARRGQGREPRQGQGRGQPPSQPQPQPQSQEPGQGTDPQRGPEPQPEHDTPASEPSAAGDGVAEVLGDWERATAHVLGAERREVFVARRVTAGLAAVPADVRRAAAARLWRDSGRLLLDDWLLECLCPGAVGLSSDWEPIAAGDAHTVMVLRELVATAVAELPAGRHREIMDCRFGLHDRPTQTLAEVGQTLGVSRECIRQLQVVAVRRIRGSLAPASRRLRTLLADLSRVEAAPPDVGPSAAERLLDLAEALLPAVAPKRAVPLLASLAGAAKARAEHLTAEATTVRLLRHEAVRREATRRARIERATRSWAALAAEVKWFGSAEPAPPRVELEALREAGSADARSGSWLCPKLGRGVAYESAIELRVIQLLGFAEQIAYYQEQPLAVSYWFDGRQRTYYPDLLAATTDGQCVLIEVKPVYEMAMAVNVAKYRALEGLCRARGWGLLLTDGRHTRALLEERSVDPDLEAALGAALARDGELSWPQLRAAAGPAPLDWAAVPALILRHGWEWRTRPYRLGAGSRPAGQPGATPARTPASPLPSRSPSPSSSSSPDTENS